jgi:hypothetical protein
LRGSCRRWPRKAGGLEAPALEKLIGCLELSEKVGKVLPAVMAEAIRLLLLKREML